MSTSAPALRKTSPPIGLELLVETPENVVLTYQLAGPTARCGAYLLDLAFRLVLWFVLTIFTACGLFALPNLSIGVWLMFAFFQEWGYFALCEGFFQGKTLGKHALGLRVVQDRGYPITFWAALLRNLVRGADVLPFLYGIGFVALLFNRKYQRLGDLLAHTVVVRERQVLRPREPVILERIEPLSRDDLGSYVPERRTLSLIDEFLGRRSVLTHERGHALASILAVELARRLDYRGDPKLVNQYPMAFLARVYVTFIERREEDDEPAEREPRPGRGRRAVSERSGRRR